jgi:hypothetical protein
MSQRPSAIGLLLCKQIIVEEGTKNVTPMNCFTQRTGEVFPWTSPPFVVLAWLTDGEGEITWEVAVEDATTLEELHRRTTSFRFLTPLQQFRLAVRLHSFTFPEPGVYRVTLAADGELIAQRKITVSQEVSHE